jgi:serine/threonine protein phosphatase PrpC
MEDRIAASTTPNGGIVIGIFDGHGGSGVAKTLARGPPSSLTEIVATAIAATNTFPEIATKSFESFDRDILYPRRGECGGSGGSTASVVNIATGGAPTVQVASVGDSDVWLFRPGSRTKILLSVPHTPYTPSERERIRKCGAHVFGGRVNGTLAVSRAFGGFEWFKMTRGETLLPPSESAVTSTPLIGEVVDIFGGDGDNEALVVAATDGFWPLGAAAVDRLWGGAMISSDGAPLQDELDRMCVAASDESHDNATAVVIRFRK